MFTFHSTILIFLNVYELLCLFQRATKIKENGKRKSAWGIVAGGDCSLAGSNVSFAGGKINFIGIKTAL